MEIQELRKIYDEKKSIYKQLEIESKYILEDVFNDENFKYDRIESRIKKFDSFEDKVNRKKITGEKIDEITDFLGLRVICLFLPDLLKAKKIIEEEFDVVSEDNKVADEEVDKFGYRSIHYIVKLKNTCKGRRYSQIKDCEFEIQVRTLAMHSWANISHHLSYKTEAAIPRELQKDFHALSALFYLADKAFESLFNESLKSKKELLKITDKKKFLNMPLNLDTLKRYREFNLSDRRISMSNGGLSGLITELKDINIMTIKALDIGIGIVNKETLQLEKEIFSEGKKDFPYESVIRASFSILSDKYSKNFTFTEELQKSIDLKRSKIPVNEFNEFKKKYLNCN